MKALAALLLATALLAACGEAEPPAQEYETRAVTLMLNWTPNAHHLGIYAAEANGWYRDAGIDLQILEPGETTADQAVGTGDVAFGISQSESLLPAREAGAPIVSIATLFPTNDSSLMALAGEGIADPGDLAGKTYGGYGGALETELVSRLVACAGADPASVAFVEVGNVDYLGGLRQDRFDFAWVFNGWDALGAEVVSDAQVTTIPFADHLDCIPDWYTPIVITSESTITDDPDLVRAFLDVTTRGYELAGEQPEEAARLLLEAVPELDPALVEASADYHAERFAAPGEQWGVQDARIWADFAAFVAEAGLTEGEVEVEASFTNEYLPDR